MCQVHSQFTGNTGGDSVLASFKSSRYLASGLAYTFQCVRESILLLGVAHDKRLQHVVISSCASGMDGQSRSST